MVELARVGVTTWFGPLDLSEPFEPSELFELWEAEQAARPRMGMPECTPGQRRSTGSSNKAWGPGEGKVPSDC